MKQKKIEEMTLTELVDEAYYLSDQLAFALRRMLVKRKTERLTKKRNAENLVFNLKEIAATLSKLSKIDYEQDIVEEQKKIELRNKWADEINAKWKTPKTNTAKR